MSIKPGNYIHYEGNEYTVACMAVHSKTFEEMVVYHQQNDSGETWVCPASEWNEEIEHNGQKAKRFTHVNEIAQERPSAAAFNKLDQGTSRLNEFLTIDEAPAIKFTPSGREKDIR